MKQKIAQKKGESYGKTKKNNSQYYLHDFGHYHDRNQLYGEWDKRRGGSP